MVQHGDFVIELVEAVSKKPFKEHEHEGKTYVEVEPDQEYFIAITRVGTNQNAGNLSVKLYVDGTWLGFTTLYLSGRDFNLPDYNGPWEVKRGDSHSTMHALKFVKPKKTSSESNMGELGRVEFRLFQAIDLHEDEKPIGEHRPVQLEAIAAKGDVARKSDKIVRSSNGTQKAKEKICTTGWNDGPLLTTKTLYYCAAKGLVQKGLLPGAGIAATSMMIKKEGDALRYKRKRALFPVPIQSSSDKPSSDDDTVDVICPPSKAIWTVDLTGLDSDSD